MFFLFFFLGVESLNPKTKKLAFSQFSKLYHGVKRADNPPHIFATADAAYRSMVTFCKDQVPASAERQISSGGFQPVEYKNK